MIYLTREHLLVSLSRVWIGYDLIGIAGNFSRSDNILMIADSEPFDPSDMIRADDEPPV